MGMSDVTEEGRNEWCCSCGCGNDAQGYKHLATCMLQRALVAEARVKTLETTLADVGKGSTHELVRYWLEKTIALEKQVADLIAERDLALLERDQARKGWKEVTALAGGTRGTGMGHE
jgi:hypothetical protein